MPGGALTRPVVDLSGIAELKGIAETADGFRFGAATSWSMIARADLPPAFDALKAAAREVGSIQIQNRGTIGGNLCNASPAADGVPPLLALDASVELASRGRAARAGALLLHHRLPQDGAARRARSSPPSSCRSPRPGARSAFVKLGARRYLVISILMAAAVVEKDEAGRIAKAAVAVGAASPVAQRLPELEQDAARPRRPAKGHPRASRRAISQASRPSRDVRATRCLPARGARLPSWAKRWTARRESI